MDTNQFIFENFKTLIRLTEKAESNRTQPDPNDSSIKEVSQRNQIDNALRIAYQRLATVSMVMGCPFDAERFVNRSIREEGVIINPELLFIRGGARTLMYDYDGAWKDLTIARGLFKFNQQPVRAFEVGTSLASLHILMHGNESVDYSTKLLEAEAINLGIDERALFNLKAVLAAISGDEKRHLLYLKEHCEYLMSNSTIMDTGSLPHLASAYLHLGNTRDARRIIEISRNHLEQLPNGAITTAVAHLLHLYSEVGLLIREDKLSEAKVALTNYHKSRSDLIFECVKRQSETGLLQLTQTLSIGYAYLEEIGQSDEDIAMLSLTQKSLILDALFSTAENYDEKPLPTLSKETIAIDFIVYPDHSKPLQLGLAPKMRLGVVLHQNQQPPKWIPLGDTHPVEQALTLLQNALRERLTSRHDISKCLSDLYQLIWSPILEHLDETPSPSLCFSSRHSIFFFRLIAS